MDFLARRKGRPRPLAWTLVAVLLCASLVLLTGAEAGAKGQLDILSHNLSVALQPGTHVLDAVDQLTVQASSTGMYAFVVGSSFAIEQCLLDGEKILYDEISPEKLADYKNEFDADEDELEGAKGFRFHIGDMRKHILEVHYRGTVYDTLEVPEYSRGTLAEETTGIIGEEGVFLSPETHWYPDRPGEYATFSIKIVTPTGFESLTEGRLVERRAGGETVETEWDVSYPSKGLYLVAGDYLVKEIDSDGVKIMGYFFPSEVDLIDSYVQASARYVAMYNKLIGPYPFSKFAVVENFFPTGYGMPSYTLLGKRVLRLPFIIHTSLGHEVAHNWWGNGVYVDYAGGNWCEGMTVYFADYRYKEAISDSAAFEYRRTINIDFTSYVNEDNDFPLSEFEERTTPASRTIGYGKSAMVFHMLKRLVGEETFYRSLRRFYEEYRFKEASWKDIRHTFEHVSGMDLESYFDQWVNGKGAPLLKLENAALHEEEGSFRIEVALAQEPAHDIRVPIHIEGEDTVYVTEISLAAPRETIDFAVDFEPVRLSVDPGHDVLRRLSPMEIPPTISAVLGDENAVIALPSLADEGKRSAYTALSEQLSRTGQAQVLEDTLVTMQHLESGAVIVLGGPAENTVHRMLELPSSVTMSADRFTVAGEDYTDAGHSAFVAFRNPVNPAASICVIAGNSAESIEQSGYKIIHYGKYSYVTFNGGQRLQAGVFPVEENPLTMHLHL
jgi:aminopeptidase N